MFPIHLRICVLATMLTLPVAACVGQSKQVGAFAGGDSAVLSVEQPDAPSTVSDKATSKSIFGVPPTKATGSPAPKFHLIIHANEYGVPLSNGEKLDSAIRSRLTASSFASTALSAGWSHMLNTPPHYGTDSGAFSERVGAVEVRQTTQSIFTYGIYAVLFHDDLRYYAIGDETNVPMRAAYAASRLVVTQKDNGRATANWPLLASIATTTALTDTYYPQRDHGFANGAKAVGLSIGTTILNNELQEFIGDGLRLLRRNRN